jgi:hypothetical protein
MVGLVEVLLITGILLMLIVIVVLLSTLLFLYKFYWVDLMPNVRVQTTPEERP